jgi:hypothetical protein
MNLTHSVIVLVDTPIGVISRQAPEVTYFMQVYLYNIKIFKSVSHSAKRTLPKNVQVFATKLLKQCYAYKRACSTVVQCFDVQNNKIKIIIIKKIIILFDMIPLVSFIL